MGRYSCQRRPTSSLYNEALLPKKVSHAVAQIPLQFDAILDGGAAGAARSLQVVSELLQEGGVAWKAVDDRDGLAAASLLFHPQFCDQARRQRFIGADAFAALAVAFGPTAAGTDAASRSGVNDSRVVESFTKPCFRSLAPGPSRFSLIGLALTLDLLICGTIIIAAGIGALRPRRMR
jgi:hypothetical protein